jgi:hydrogenase expression/formation protein HypC
MCIGLPMRIVTLGLGSALAEVDGAARTISTAMLMDEPQVGDWVLVHNQLAIRLIDAHEAAQIRDALSAVLAAERGEPFEHLLNDLAAGGAGQRGVPTLS